MCPIIASERILLCGGTYYWCCRCSGKNLPLGENSCDKPRKKKKKKNALEAPHRFGARHHIYLMSKRLAGLIMSNEKGINKQGCPLLAYFGHDVFVFSMIACR